MSGRIYTCKFSGRLGNILLETALVFARAESEQAAFDHVVLCRDYTANNGLAAWQRLNPACSGRIDGYLVKNKIVFGPAWKSFVDKSEYERLVRASSTVFCKDGPDKAKFKALRSGLVSSLFYSEPVYAAARAKYPGYFNEVSTALHVRRCDFAMWKDGVALASAEDVQRQLESACTKSVVVFSDDIDWCKASLREPNGKTLTFHKAGTACDDLILMSNFRHVIYNNHSSYGLFAAKMSADLTATGRMAW